MKFKNILIASLMLFSLGAHALPPVPPETVLSGISLLLARNCYVNGEISVADLKNTSTIKFILRLKPNGETGILEIYENGALIDELPVECRKN